MSIIDQVKNKAKGSKAGKMWELKKQADRMKKIEVEEEVGDIRLVLNGDFEVQEVWEGDERRKDVEKAFSKAAKKIKKKMAKQMRGSLPDML
ncbi:MAG: hypothetical protein ACOC6Q_01325 [Patescibacteria group bacterium]